MKNHVYLKKFTVTELKEEIEYRRVLARAQKHLSSAEAAAIRAQAKVDQYRKVLENEKRLQSEKPSALKKSADRPHDE